MSLRNIASMLLAVVSSIIALRTCAAEPPVTVALDRSRGWSIAAGKDSYRGGLARELTRQAFLLAARDELGLSTLDAWLGDSLPAVGDNPPYDVLCSAGEPSLIEVVRGFEGRQALVWQQEIPAAGSPFDYPSFVSRTEDLSRGEFVALLRQGGYANHASSGAAAPASATSVQVVAGWLQEMSFLPQFAAVRALHRQVRAQGDSPRALAGLARGYANLGVLTEYFWNPLHEVFKARALLYAERCVVREKGSAAALASRGYVRALLGLHAAALADFSAARASQGGAQPLPAWVDLLEGFCRFDPTALESVQDPGNAPLAALLRLLAAEQSGVPGLAPRVAMAEVARAPDCLRIQDGFFIRYGEDEPDERYQLPANGEAALARALYPRLQQFADLPPAVQKLLAAGAAERALAGNQEPELRGQVTLALLGAEPTAGDDAELSWALLGRMIQEASFYQAWRALRPDIFGKDAAQMSRLLPTVPTHRYRGFLAMAQSDPTAHRKGYNKLQQARDLDALTLREYPVLHFATGLNALEHGRVLRSLLASADHLPGDIAVRMRFLEYQPGSEARLLFGVSPYAPLVRINLARFAWKDFSQYAADWEQTSSRQPAVLAAIGHQQLESGHLADAQRLLSAALELEPAPSTMGDLAEVYRRQGKAAARIELLKRQLALENLEHPEATQIQLAVYSMETGDWKQARSYADAAASGGTVAGHLIAAEVYEAAQRWDTAEEHVRTASEMQAPFPLTAEWLEWYSWCQRTGQGDAAAAHRLALACVQKRRISEKYRRADTGQLLLEATFYLLLNNHEQALQRFDFGFAAGHDPWFGLHSALLKDRLEETKARDERLTEIAQTRPQWLQAHADRPQEPLYALAALLADDLAQGGKADCSEEKWQALAAGGSEAEQIDFYYFLGEYFSLHDRPANAVKAWHECMIRLPLRAPNRTFAGRALWNAAITPATYRNDLLSRAATHAESPKPKP